MFESYECSVMFESHSFEHVCDFVIWAGHMQEQTLQAMIGKNGPQEQKLQAMTGKNGIMQEQTLQAMTGRNGRRSGPQDQQALDRGFGLSRLASRDSRSTHRHRRGQFDVCLSRRRR